jgi:hypothetical protein
MRNMRSYMSSASLFATFCAQPSPCWRDQRICMVKVPSTTRFTVSHQDSLVSSSLTRLYLVKKMYSPKPSWPKRGGTSRHFARKASRRWNTGSASVCGFFFSGASSPSRVSAASSSAFLLWALVAVLTGSAASLFWSRKGRSTEGSVSSRSFLLRERGKAGDSCAGNSLPLLLPALSGEDTIIISSSTVCISFSSREVRSESGSLSFFCGCERYTSNSFLLFSERGRRGGKDLVERSRTGKYQL